MSEVMAFERALAYGQEVYDELRFLDPRDFDWWTAAKQLIESGVFTVPQVAALVNKDPVYVRQKTLAEYGRTEGVRTRGGVSGKFNPETLMDIRMLRTDHFSYQSKRLPSHLEDRVVELLKKGNGVRLLAHLTGIPDYKINRIRRDHAARGQ